MQRLRKKFVPIVFLSFGIFMLYSCTGNDTTTESKIKLDQKQNEKMFTETLTTMLRSIKEKDLDALKSTMSPTGEMQLILPNSKVTNTVDEFVAFHEEWFKDSTWTMEVGILNTKVGDRIGMATTEAKYREPSRNGKPYFNHLMVSYVLEKKDNKWYVIKDHACSIEKTAN